MITIKNPFDITTQCTLTDTYTFTFSLWSLTTLHIATMQATQGPDKQGMEKHTGKMPKRASSNSKFLQSMGQKPGQSNEHSTSSSLHTWTPVPFPMKLLATHFFSQAEET